MIEPCDRARLELETPEAPRVVDKIGRQQLQRDVAVELGILGEIHLTHTPDSKSRDNFVLSEARADWKGHGFPLDYTCQIKTDCARPTDTGSFAHAADAPSIRLSMSIEVRLSVMNFLQFFVWARG